MTMEALPTPIPPQEEIVLAGGGELTVERVRTEVQTLSDKIQAKQVSQKRVQRNGECRMMVIVMMMIFPTRDICLELDCTSMLSAGDSTYGWVQVS